jgi:transcription antitermination protein NusB
MARRRQAREIALQLLFQHDLNPEIKREAAEEFLHENLKGDKLREFAWNLYRDTVAQRDKLDQKIQGIADNWRVSRMAVADRNLIRMGICEMETVGTPSAVVLDEIIELAKIYGTVQSSQFVNGLLDKLIPATDAETPAT